MPDQAPKIAENSRYALVMVTARRARQLMKEANAKGVAPSEVALVNVGYHKPVKLALEEVTQGVVGYKIRKTIKPAPKATPAELVAEASTEPSPEAPAEGSTEEAAASKKEGADASE